MSEKKQFSKKTLNQDDYKKDEKIVGGLKKVSGMLLGVGLFAVSVFAKGKFDMNKKD